MSKDKLEEKTDPEMYIDVESINRLKDDITDMSNLQLPPDNMFPENEDHLLSQPVTELREQDRWLPINNVARLMKNTLPTSAKVSKDAKECMQECVSEFISFVTSEASDRCAADKRKTINGEDILISLHALGFENYAEVLKIYLAKYRQYQAVRNQQMFEDNMAEEVPDTMEGPNNDSNPPVNNDANPPTNDNNDTPPNPPNPESKVTDDTEEPSNTE